MEAETDIMNISVHSRTSTYKELVDLMTHATAKLKLDWPVEKEDINRGRTSGGAPNHDRPKVCPARLPW